MPNTNISVVDSTTYAAIVGANVFVNGLGQGQTNTSGQVSIPLTSSTYTLSVTTQGYNTLTVPNLSSGSPFTALMVFIPPTTATVSLSVNPEDPAVGQTFTFDNDGSPITATYAEGGISVPGLTFGVQNVSASIDDYQPVNQTVDTTQQTQLTVELIASSDTGVAQAASPQGLAPITTNANTLPALTPSTNPEFIPPNTGQGTYFTMTQARLYIGRVFIDELNGIQFALQNNKIPIYGYASRDFDAIAQGKSLVQGQFTINFISEGYLYVTLKDYLTNVGNDSTQISATQQSNQAQLNSLTSKLQNPDPAWTPETVAAAAADINNLVANMGPDALASAKAGIAQANVANNNNLLGLAGGDYPNAVYQDVGFDIVIQYTGAGRTVVRRLEGCRLISNESIMDQSGTPVLDSYGFIARRLR